MIDPSLWMRSMVLAVLLSVVGAQAQPITAESRDATEEEEALIRQGFIFFPPLRVRSDEQLQQLAREAAQKKAAEEARKQAAQEAQERAEKAKAEAELAAKQLEDRRAHLQAEEAARVLAAQQAAELKARQEAEEVVRKQAAQEAQARAEKAKAEAELAAKQLEERRVQLQAEEAARAMAAQKAAELKARQDAEDAAKKQAAQEVQARAEKAKAEAELAAKQLEERRAQLQAEDAARALAARQAARARDQAQAAQDQIKRAELQAIQAQAEKTKQEATQAVKDLEDRTLKLKVEDEQRQLESRRLAELRAEEDAKSMANKQAAHKAHEEALKAKAEAKKAKEEAERALKLLNERRVQIEELRVKKLAEQKAQEQAEKLARMNQQAQIEAVEAARRLAARQAQRLKQAQTTAHNQQFANDTKQVPPVDLGKQSAYGAAVVETARNLQQGKWVHNDGQHNVSLSKDSFFFQRYADQGLKYSLGVESGGKGGKASLNFDVGVVRQPFSYGAYVGVKDNALDFGVNAVWSQAPFAYGLAIGQQRGEEVYPYFSGPENTKVINNSYLLDFAHTMDLGLIKNMGVSYWRSTGKQRGYLSPVLIDVESDLYIDTYLDHRKLSLGTLYGYSIRTQGALPFNSSYRLNLGQESVAYQYWSGASDKRSKSYLDIDFKNFLNERSAIGLGYKKGVVEDSKYFDYIDGNWRVRLDNKKSINQTDDNIGVGIYYEQDFGSMAKAKVNDSVSVQSIDVSKKPSQFPDGFLVKVDPTAVVLQSRLVKGAIQLIGTTSLGIFNDLIEPSRRNINIQIPLSNSNGEPVSVELVEGHLPPGLSLNASGVISGAAAAVATDTVYRFKIAASSRGAQPYRNQEFSIIIKAPSTGDISFEMAIGNTYFAEISGDLGLDYRFYYSDGSGILLRHKPDDSSRFNYYLENNGTKLVLTDSIDRVESIINSRNGDSFATTSVLNGIYTIYEKFIKMLPLQSSDFLNKTLSIASGCVDGSDESISVDSMGNWINSCGESGRIFLTTSGESCQTASRGFRRPISGVMCMMNISRNKAWMVALRSGSFSAGGTLQFIDRDDESPRQWIRTFMVP